MEVGLQRDIVLKQLEMLRFLNTFTVFSNESDFSMECSGSKLFMEWKNKEERAVLKADLSDFNFDILAEKNGEIIYQYK